MKIKRLFLSLFPRRILRHFRRLLLLETLTQTGLSKEVPNELNKQLHRYATCSKEELLDILGSSEQGLSYIQVNEIREKTGFNEVEHDKPLSWWMHLWLSYRNPFNILLTILAIINILTDDDLTAAVIIGAMVILSTLLRFVQEARANKAADALKAMVSNTATVIRRRPHQEQTATSPEGHGDLVSLTEHSDFYDRLEVPMKELVPGDMITLSAGDMVPADCRLISAKDLFVAQAAMTGESMPVEKFSSLCKQQTSNPLELNNLVFMGTNIVSGTAKAIVITTGSQTYFGILAQRITATDRAPTSFQLGVNKVSWLLIRFMMVMVPLVLFINGFTKGDWLEALMFALSIAVGLTPEMLPMVVTATLAKGAVVMSGKKVIVKRLDAIQNFGAMDILCTDKTGTLTQDKIALERHLDIDGSANKQTLQLAYLNSYHQSGLKNLLDVAVLERGQETELSLVHQQYEKYDEIPFDFERRRMTVVVKDEKNQHLMITKGAVEEILSVCAYIRKDGKPVALDAQALWNIRQICADLNEEGLRVVAVATRIMTEQRDAYNVQDEKEMVLEGYLAFLDPPKDSTTTAIKALAEHGIAVKVLTGDNELVAEKVCRDVGLQFNAEDILCGSKIENMNDEQLRIVVEKTVVFARLTPTHKARIVRLLKENGHIVGFMGDGINDAPALRTADIGISVDTGVDIAKEAADIIMLEKSLMVLEEGVREGRRTFANMLKYIKMTASSNFGNVFSVLLASAFIPFLPMLPIHLLIQNLLYDISQTAIPFDNVDEDQLKKPQHWNPKEIGRFMIFFGPISSIFDILTYAMMWYVFKANTPEHQTLFQSGWFVVGLLTQTLIVHMIRTPKVPFIQSRAATPLMVMTAIIMAIGIWLPMGPLAGYLKLEALPPLYFVFLPMILFGYMALTQVLKGIYIRRYGWQ